MDFGVQNVIDQVMIMMTMTVSPATGFMLFRTGLKCPMVHGTTMKWCQRMDILIVVLCIYVNVNAHIGN